MVVLRGAGDREMEGRIIGMIRWNAMAMVQRGNSRFEGLGGHLSSYASSATLYEVGFNHFWRAASDQRSSRAAATSSASTRSAARRRSPACRHIRTPG